MKKPMLIVAMLAMVAVAIVPALAQDGDFDVVLAEKPVPTCGWISSTGASDPSDHVPGEFVVSYESMEAMWAAPQENVKDTFEHWGWYDTETGPVYFPIPYESQVLYFEDIASIADPCERFAAEEAKLQEISAWPGVESVGYNGIAITDDPVEPAA